MNLKLLNGFLQAFYKNNCEICNIKSKKYSTSLETKTIDNSCIFQHNLFGLLLNKLLHFLQRSS